jgi:hypothetical protein
MMTERNHKILSNIIITTKTLIGFQILVYLAAIYQFNTYFHVAVYFFAFHIFWLAFLFDLRFRERGVLGNIKLNHRGLSVFWQAFKARVRHIFNWHNFTHLLAFLVLPNLIFWSTVVLISLNPFREQVKQFIVLGGTIAIGTAYWYFNERFTRKLEVHEFGLKLLNLVKLYAAFLVFSALLGLTWYFGLGTDFLVMSIFVFSFLLLYQALFQHRLFRLWSEIYILGIAGLCSLVGLWLYNFWNAQYFTGGLVILAVYNAFWGILHHFLDRSLTSKIVWEYLFLMLVIFSLLFATHDFAARVL